MDMLQEHVVAMDSASTVYHEFLIKYKPHHYHIYGIVEGKQDPCFYQSIIENSLPKNWRLQLIPAGSKKNVINAISAFDWTRFNRKRICFFVDRDLSEFLEETRLGGGNIYITDKYSIENELTDFQTFERCLKEVYNINPTEQADWQKIENLYKKNLDFFEASMAPLMAQILLWRSSGHQPHLNNIDLGDIFNFENGEISPSAEYPNDADRLSYIANKLNLPANDRLDIATVQGNISASGEAENFIRGKYVLWFFISCLTSLHGSIKNLIGIPTPKIAVAIGPKNALVVIGPRIRAPDSLQVFIKVNYLEYIYLSGPWGVNHLH